MSKILYEKINIYAQSVWRYSAASNVYMWAYHARYGDLSIDPSDRHLEILDFDHQCEYARSYIVWNTKPGIIEDASCEHCHDLNPEWFNGCAIRLRLANSFKSK